MNQPGAQFHDEICASSKRVLANERQKNEIRKEPKRTDSDKVRSTGRCSGASRIEGVSVTCQEGEFQKLELVGACPPNLDIL
jgi:hypothetical protein